MILKKTLLSLLHKIRKSGADGAVRNYTIEFKDTISENETISKTTETEYYASVLQIWQRPIQFLIYHCWYRCIVALVFFYSAFTRHVEAEDKAYNELYSAYQN